MSMTRGRILAMMREARKGTLSAGKVSQLLLLFAERLPVDHEAGDPKRGVPATMAWQVGSYWTEAKETPLCLLTSIHASAISNERLESVSNAEDLPAIEIVIFPHGQAKIFDGHHHLVDARRKGKQSIKARFTFPD